MSKELFVTSTPHETKLAVVEDDQLVEVFFERENEYTLAGSIYKGKVTRVLPGMQSAFVDIGLERDAFLYVTDFLEEVESEDEDAVSASPKGEQQSPSGEPRESREGGERPNREGGSRRGRGRDRDRGARRSEQHRAAQSSELKPAEEPQEPSFSEPDGNVDEIEAGSEATSETDATQSQPSGDRLPRRWRGRRGRRRGRSFLNDSKYTAGDEQKQEASATGPVEDNEAAEPRQAEHHEANSYVVEHDATGDLEDENDAAEMHHQPDAHQQRTESQRETEQEQKPQHAREESRSHEPKHRGERQQESRQERKPDQRPQRILLPGESLAKYNRTESSGEKTAEPQAGVPAQRQVPRPSTEVEITSPSLSAGVLAGESIAKYRNRPEPQAEREKPERHKSEHKVGTPAIEEPKEISEEMAPEQQPRGEGYDVHASHIAAEKHRHEPVSAHQPEVEQNEPEAEAARGEYNFSPGSGVIEEEEIAEEEHDSLPDVDEFDEEGFEELEEETLEEEADSPEGNILAAGEGLAAALMESRNPTKPVAYVADEEEEDGEDEGEETEVENFNGEQQEKGEDEQEQEEEAAFTLEGGYQGPELDEPESDPEDPNYSARAEMRGPASTAGFQQKTERGFDRARRGGNRRGGRPQRGGRPMRGGPRRNIPRGPMPQINELLKEGQEILVQIAKEPMAKKGARITSHIALPGRFLVFMPTVNHTGVSRKIGSEEERQRLKRILISEKGTSHGGFIVRTAATGASEEDLRADIRFLINLWGEIKQRAETSKAPALIYHDLNLVERILRDQVTTTFSQIWVDHENEYERILRFASRFQPSLVRRVKLYSKEVPLFEEFSIQDEINKALKSKVWLKSGGYIVINQTEALVAIDINTGKYVGKTARLEDTIVKTNIDAIKEIVRQIRLRDLGGIIVIDFIDMDERKNRQRVMQALEEALKSDRSPSKVLQFNDFGLVAITRKRVKQSLERTLGTQCTYCTGTGMIKSVATVCNEIYVELRKMSKHFDNNQITLRVNPEVGKALKENGGKWLLEMEELTKKTIIVKSDPAQHQEQFDVH